MTVEINLLALLHRVHPTNDNAGEEHGPDAKQKKDKRKVRVAEFHAKQDAKGHHAARYDANRPLQMGALPTQHSKIKKEK